MDEIASFIATYEDGLSIKQTAVVCQVSETTISRWLKRRGVKLRPQSFYPRPERKYDFSETEIKTMCDMALAGKKIDKIAKVTGRSWSNICIHLNKAGIQKRFRFDEHINANTCTIRVW